ncbi:hypothetical protein ARAM_001587 [Aspergillus rambellii]|uniref:Mediator of RNA polymerase II transcription subunit 17 n=1 Tax=Aspergillus rambellii TaxID=308745 RepID=A0A0F8X9R7_9EURO|nr:hypothetical protein ARAM_001587 [Aspergillus rambellii]
MSDPFSLPLRPVIEKHDRPDSLPREIAQINAQWGSFRDVSEASLRAHIEEDEDKDPWAGDRDSENAAAEVDTSERRDQLYKRRAEITQFALQAHMEALFALDFVSLLLSKYTPRQAETSMSAFLKSAAPLGTLNSELVNPPPRPEALITDVKSVSRGWRLQNFDAAANKLLKCAARLETEVQAETRYWNGVLAVKEKGWKVCRLPREGQALGVQYGFLEATPIFRDRGLAALRRTDDGNLVLDKGLMPQKAQAVRVRVKSRGRVTGCSKAYRPTKQAESIERRILQARDTLFEEELFHELVREARILGSQGVTTRQNLVQLPVSEEQEILLDLVDGEDMTSNEDASDSSEHDVLADVLAHSIRILLSYSHRQNHRRRTQPPPPISKNRRPAPEYHILRPIIAYLQHDSHVRWLESFMKDIHGVLNSAGLKCEFHATPFASIGTLQPNKSVPTVEALVRVFLTPFESTFSGNLVTPQSFFKVQVRTNPAVPPFGTHYDISINLPQNPDVQPPTRIGLQDEVAAVITHFIMLDITSAIALQSPQIGQDILNSHQESASKVSWEVAYPHHGELLAVTSTGQSKKMKVSLSRQELALQIYSSGRADGINQPIAAKSPTLQSQTWKPNLGGSHPSVMDFVARVSQI